MTRKKRGVVRGAGAWALAAICASILGAAVRAYAQTAEANVAPWEKTLVLPEHVAARVSWAQRSLGPSGLRKLQRLAVAAAPTIAAGTDFALIRKQAERDTLATFPGLSGMDVSEAAFIVLAMAAKDMDDDLRAIMAEVKATNAAKQKAREEIQQLNEWISQEKVKPGTPGTAQPAGPAVARRAILEKTVSPVIRLEYVKAPRIPPLPPRNSGATVPTLKALLDELKGDLDSMNEISEMTSLRLQMTMDRRSKFISTLSNIMKKVSTTQETLVQNIK